MAYAEAGNFSIIVSPNGQVSGFSQSAAGGNVSVVGVVVANGMLIMAGQAPGGQANFNGFINPATGELVCTWRLANGAQATFQGMRQ